VCFLCFVRGLSLTLDHPRGITGFSIIGRATIPNSSTPPSSHSNTRAHFNNLCGIAVPPIARGDNGSPVPPLGSPPSTPIPVVPRDGGQLQDPPRTDNLKEERIVDRLARGARKIFKTTTRKFHEA